MIALLFFLAYVEGFIAQKFLLRGLKLVIQKIEKIQENYVHTNARGVH